MDAVTNEAILKRFQTIVVACVVVVFVLVAVVCVQFGVMASNRAKEAKLSAQYDELTRQIERAETDSLYYQTNNFREEYALKHLGWGKVGEVIFEA